MKKRMLLPEKLEAYRKSDFYPFHMPGHKRNPLLSDYPWLPFPWDITEIDGFDNLHHPEGILLDARRFLSEIYGTKESFYSVNGSTAALLAAVFSAVKKGGKLLVARNCHKSVYHAMYLREIRPVYLYPSFEPEFRINGGISAEDVRQALEQDSEIQAVLITSPTYDGVVSDVKAIAELAHEKGIPLVADEAHGAHFHFSDYFPVSSAELGADLVVQSLHKTLPSLTQTAVLHCCSDRVDRNRIVRYLQMFQSSSPSYVLMAGMDACMQKLQREGEGLFRNYTALLGAARFRLKDCRKIRLISEEIVGRVAIFDLDRSKLLFSTEYASITAAKLASILRDTYHLEMEMTAENYVTALTSVGDTAEGFERLCIAIEEIDAACGYGRRSSGHTEDSVSLLNRNRFFSGEKGEMSSASPRVSQSCSLQDALDGEQEEVPLQESAGRISAEFVYLYPPGIPLAVPGEEITPQLAEKIEAAKREGLALQGMRDYTGKMILVLKRPITPMS